MSINLETTEGEEAELYLDFRNIYLVFLLRLSPTQIEELSDKILYKIKSNVPEHKQAYEFIIVGLCYANSSLPKKIIDHCFKQILVKDNKQENSNSNGSHNSQNDSKKNKSNETEMN